MEQLNLLSYEPSAVIARDHALEQVEANNLDWSALALIQFKQLFFANGIKNQSICFTGETIRHKIRPYVGDPHHPGAWGAFTMNLLRAGLIEKTGEYVPMQDERSHARITAVYRLVSQ